MKSIKNMKILGLSPLWYAIIAVISLAAIYLNIMPGGMIGALLAMLVFGELLNLIGNNLPIVKTFLGGGPIIVIFAGAAIVYFHLVPAEVTNNITSFMKGGGFLNFYIAALITGSILGMSRDLLIKAAVRYLPCIIGGVLAALGLVALFAPIVGFSPREAIAYIGIPIMGGGMGAGAVPISKVFEQALHIDADKILGKLVPAVALGNAGAIVVGGFLNKLGEKFPSLTGNGQLLVSNNEEFTYKTREIKDATVEDYGTGIALATAFFALGAIIAFLFKKIGLNIHTYAWMIISVAIVKATNIMPEKYEDACAIWYKFIAKNFTPALLLGIGIAYTNLGDVASAFTIQYVVLVLIVLVGAVIGSGLIGKLVGFYPVESAITAGLCMANMGGTGDVAVLTASKRMELMPFAQISSRIGGALIILLASLIVPLFFG